MATWYSKEDRYLFYMASLPWWSWCVLHHTLAHHTCIWERFLEAELLGQNRACLSSWWIVPRRMLLLVVGEISNFHVFTNMSCQTLGLCQPETQKVQKCISLWALQSCHKDISLCCYFLPLPSVWAWWAGLLALFHAGATQNSGVWCEGGCLPVFSLASSSLMQPQPDHARARPWFWFLQCLFRNSLGKGVYLLLGNLYKCISSF